jgi:hypothetical protein
MSLEVLDASKDANEKLDQLSLGCMGARALSKRNGMQAVNQAEVLGVLAKQDQPSMVSGEITGRLGREMKAVAYIIRSLRKELSVQS